MNLYPIFLNIKDKLAIIIGGGDVALRKVKDLLNAGAMLRIISPEIGSELQEKINRNTERIEYHNRKYNEGDLEGADLVFSATNDSTVNKKIFKEASEKKILINSVDDPDNCSFFVPSHIHKGDLTLAVSTGGASPAMAARLRRIFEDSIPGNIEEILQSLKETRSVLQTINTLTSSARGDILRKIVNDDRALSDLVKSYKNNKIEKFLNQFI